MEEGRERARHIRQGLVQIRDAGLGEAGWGRGRPEEDEEDDGPLAALPLLLLLAFVG
jgi:hypothetical protein